ncbi:hypothetical protein CANINC_002038 [Pichia inconspicua]|uniref:Uncharacterized protein n=1 Tax=Pichia inconspicua TaxID=52247 RepID=A0A4V4NFT2_9ASCO|nr:hypothetical protein CANINC_002038 [[Candida] inconspicua]
MHKSCFFSIVSSNSLRSDAIENQLTVEKLLTYFNGTKFTNDAVSSDKHRYFRSRLSWPKYNFKNWLVLSFFKPNQSRYRSCNRCGVDSQYYGHKNPFTKINRIFDCLKTGSFVLAVTSFGTIFTVSVLEFFGIYLGTSMNWIDRYSVITIGSQMFTLHFLYSLITPAVSLTNLLVSSLYAQVGLGIGYTIPHTLKNFIQLKFALKFFHRLTLNYYYFTAFKTTNSVLFGTKLSIEDAALILDHQLFDGEELDTPKRRTISLFHDLSSCLKEDFGVLFEDGQYHYWKDYLGGIVILTTGQFLSKLDFYSNPFYSDSQNAATRAVVAFAVIQLLDYAYTNWNAISLSRCYKTFLPADDMYKRWVIPIIQYSLKYI